MTEATSDRLTLTFQRISGDNPFDAALGRRVSPTCSSDRSRRHRVDSPGRSVSAASARGHPDQTALPPRKVTCSQKPRRNASDGAKDHCALRAGPAFSMTAPAIM
jgi:hypothetical protein